MILWTYLAKRFGNAAAALILAVIAILLAFAVYQGIKHYFSDAPAKQAELNKGQAGAAIDAGAMAGNITSAVTANASATDTTVKGGLDEIRSAPAASRNIASQCAACRLRGRSSGTDQRCAALRKAGSCEPAEER